MTPSLLFGNRSRDRHRTLPPTFCSASFCSSKTKSLKRAKLLRKQRNWHRIIHLPSNNLSSSILRAKTMRPVIAESMKFFRNSQMKEFNKARDAYEKVIAANPTLVLTLNNLAYIYAEKLNDLKRASELAQKARSNTPTNPSVLDTLGWITYKQGDYKQAADLL